MRKKIACLFPLTLLVLSCGVFEPNTIKIYVENDLFKHGIDIWNENFEYVDNDYGIGNFNIGGADIILKYGDDYQSLGGICNWDGNGERPNPLLITIKKSVMEIKFFRDIIIAHEIGHALGYKHNNNPDSIMNPDAITHHGKVEDFEEFK